MFLNDQNLVEDKIIEYCLSKDYPDPSPLSWSSIPFLGEWGISTAFFKLASLIAQRRKGADERKKSVPELAQEIASDIADTIGVPTNFLRVDAINGYLNLIYDPAIFSTRLIQTIHEKGNSFGQGDSKNELIMIEFSQPNTHKSFHVGHLRSAILGDVLCRIHDQAGYDVLRVNYYGDIGLHVIKWMWNYINFHHGEKPPQETTKWMGELYAEANKRLEEHPELEAAVRELYQRWDQRDPEITAVWQETRQWSIDGFKELYDILDIKFDRDFSNSDAEKPGKIIVDELIEEGIAEDERPEGPVIVRIDALLGLQKEKYKVLVILRSDGTALYATEDLALAKIKFSEFPLNRSLYVVDVRQSLHFKQIFKTLEIAGYPWAVNCHHVPYELVNLPGNVVMASREGTVVLLEELIQEAMDRARAVVEEKNPDLSETEKTQIAKAVGIGAIKYPMLARENTKVVTFNWETALDFNGKAAPYIQYAHVRANSILRKANEELGKLIEPKHILEPSEVELIDLLSRYPDDVQRAASELKPLIITNLAYDTAKAFNNFYNQCPVLKTQPDIRNFRLHLVAGAKQVIANELSLLGITPPEIM